MIRIGQGSTVTVSYIGTLDNGKIFHDSAEHGPLTFTIGADQIFPVLEQAIVGMKAGEVKNISLSPEEAYGPRREENMITVARETFPAGKAVIAGQKVSIEFRGGASRLMLVTGVTDTAVKLDGNHPLAGRALTFALRVDRIA